MVNKLDARERAQIVRCLVEGNSIRSTVRMTGFAKNTITKLLVELGEACIDYQDRTLRGLTCQNIQADEIWTFVGMKAKNVPEEKRGQFGYGDMWTWTVIDSDTKLMVSWLVGERSHENAEAIMADVASRVITRPQITTDANWAYQGAVERAFGANADFAQLRKEYGVEKSEDGSATARRYSPNMVTAMETRIISGSPDPTRVSTSNIERANLTMRMGMRRFTRLTNGYSKKVENLAAAVSLHFMHYNFARPNMALGKNTTPAMAAGVADHVWTCEEIAELLD